MKIRYKILFSLLSMFALLCVVTLTTYLASQSVDYYRKKTLLLEKKLVTMTNLRAQVRNQLLETYEVGFIEDLESHQQDLVHERELVQEKFKLFTETFANDDQTHIIETLRAEYKGLDDSLAEVAKLLARGDLENAKLALLEARTNKFNNGFIKKISLFAEAQKEMTKASSQDLESSIVRLQHMLIIFSVTALLMVGVLLIFVSKSIGDRLYQLEGATRKIAEGNYNINLPEKGSDEVSALSKAFNIMANSLTESKEKLTKQQEIITHTSKMSALGEMAGGIAHEINTPLAAIILNAEMIEMQNSDLPEPNLEITAHSESIIEIGSRIAKIIMGLKGFSRDASNDEKETFIIRDLISTTIDLCNEKFKNHGVHIKIDEEFLDTKINGQIIQLSQTLLNLLNNSYDAIENLEEKWVRIKVVVNEHNIELRVIDSGKGLSLEVANKIFTPFFTTKDIGKGTGLGLSISKNIMKQHGGDLFCDTDSPNTCFVIQLPNLESKRT